MRLEYDARNNTFDLYSDSGALCWWFHGWWPDWLLRYKIRSFIAKYNKNIKLQKELSKEIGV